jgi:hypothetical protein
MAEQTIDNQTLLRRTLVTSGTMLGACVVVVGTLSLIALTIVGHALSASDPTAASDAGHTSSAAARPGSPASPVLAPPNPLPSRK